VSDGKRVEVSFTRHTNAEEAALTKLRQQKLKVRREGSCSHFLDWKKVLCHLVYADNHGFSALCNGCSECLLVPR